MRALAIFAALVPIVACVGTTGGEVVDFPTAAAGPSDAPSGGSFSFKTDRGWSVTLTKATLHIGALYLSQSQPVSGAQVTSCVLPGTYVAQVTTGMDVDLLSPTPQKFPVLGHGTTLEALIGQVWLSGGATDHDVDQTSDTTPILILAGDAMLNGTDIPFSGLITIASNRIAQGGELAGSNTVCKQRIVSPIPTRLTIQETGGLLLRIDPRLLFVNVDFSQLLGGVFSDDPADVDPTSPTYYSQPSFNLYENLHSTGSVNPLYSFSWDSSL